MQWRATSTAVLPTRLPGTPIRARTCQPYGTGLREGMLSFCGREKVRLSSANETVVEPHAVGPERDSELSSDAARRGLEWRFEGGSDAVEGV